MVLALSSVKQEFTTELESIIESDEAYGSNVQVLTYALKEDVINGKFKDSWNNRVYEFIIDTGGISYKPAIKLDSFSADEMPVRFDTYSEGYLSLFKDDRFDRNPIGKRVKKPKCGGTAYGCGFSCIGIQKTCRILGSGKKAESNQGNSIGKGRISKLIDLAKKLYNEGDKRKSFAINSQARSLQVARDKHTSEGNARKSERNTGKQKEIADRPLSNKEFKTIGDAETREKLKQWAGMQAELEKLNERRGAKGFDKKRSQAATEIIESLFDMMDYSEHTNFGGVVDSNGKLQAAYISRETDKGYYVDFLASAPWNCLESHPDKRKGAGASAMEAIVRTAVSKNKGRINLQSTTNAVPFYEKVGFKKQKGGAPGYPDMMLSKEDAQKFLETQEEKNRKDADLITKNNNLTELELLEEEVLGLFTVPQDVHRRVIKKIESRASNS